MSSTESGKTPADWRKEIERRVQEEARKRKLGAFPIIGEKSKSPRRR